MDDDEVMVLWLGVFVAGIAGVRWYRPLLFARTPRSTASRQMRRALVALPVTLTAALFSALCTAAAREVRAQGEYVVLFLLLGIAWSVPTLRALAWLGVSAADDAIERENLAAGYAVCGAVVASTVCYAFANFGEGPTIWTTIGPAILGSLTCGALWAAYQSLPGAADAISIERNVPAGLRFAGMSVGSSLIVGRSLAGDYVSADATWHDWVHEGWPALPLVVLAALVQRALSAKDRVFTSGLLPAIVYVAIGVADIVWFGLWSSGSHS